MSETVTPPEIAPTDAVLSFKSYKGWMSHLEVARGVHDRRYLFDQAFQQLDRDDLWSGYCPLCNAPRHYTLHGPDLREQIVCDGCAMNGRARAAVWMLERGQPRGAVYCTEQASTVYAWVRKHHYNAIGSEYFQDTAVQRRMQWGLKTLGIDEALMFQDATNLTFDSGSLGAILSLDVLEHIPDYRQALREFARVLEAGGTLILTAPFLPMAQKTLVRARLGAQGVEHVQAPEYHGDPLGCDGILCFYHFGWDLLDDVHQAGFSSVAMTLPWVPSFGMVGPLWTLVARK